MVTVICRRGNGLSPRDLQAAARAKIVSRCRLLATPRCSRSEIRRPAVTNDPGNPGIRARPGSVHWNAHRKRWIAVFGELFGTSSVLGEVWYAEAASLTGPWKDARKILTHDGYSFYNVVHHSFLDDGPIIYFEGTYTTLFSRTKVKTPRYDYNQILYRLNLDDLR